MLLGKSRVKKKDAVCQEVETDGRLGHGHQALPKFTIRIAPIDAANGYNHIAIQLRKHFQKKISVPLQMFHDDHLLRLKRGKQHLKFCFVTIGPEACALAPCLYPKLQSLGTFRRKPNDRRLAEVGQAKEKTQLFGRIRRTALRRIGIGRRQTLIGIVGMVLINHILQKGLGKRRLNAKSLSLPEA